MDRIPIETLLAPCSADGSVGRNLEYDSRHVSMCECSEGSPEQEFGDTIIDAREPDWKKLYSVTKELCIETRDLRVAVRFAESLCRLYGLAGLADGLRVVHFWSTEFWKDVYPPLDTDDDSDPVERLGALNRLCHPEYLLDGLQKIRLVEDPTLGAISLRDLRRASTADSTDSVNTLTHAEIEAILLSVNLDDLRTTGDLIQDCLNTTESLERFLAEKIGPSQWDAVPLLSALRECSNAIENAYGQRVGVVHHTPFIQSSQSRVDGSRERTTVSQSGSSEKLGKAPTPENNSTHLSIETRADAMEVLDCLCTYFQKFEPASPVPLLLQRAKRLIPMSFVDILRELAPDGLNQAMQSVGAAFDDVR